MNLIKAVIPPSRLDDVLLRLDDIDVVGMTTSDCAGHGKNGENVVSYRCGDIELRVLLPQVMIELVVPASQSGAAVEAIMLGARMGNARDGKIFVSPIERVVRIRTGETDTAALAGAVSAHLPQN